MAEKSVTEPPIKASPEQKKLAAKDTDQHKRRFTIEAEAILGRQLHELDKKMFLSPKNAIAEGEEDESIASSRLSDPQEQKKEDD